MAGGKRDRPSRLVLSTRVANMKQKPSAGGLNVREANLPPPRPGSLRDRRPGKRLDSNTLSDRQQTQAQVQDRTRKSKPNFKHMKMAQSLSPVSWTQRTNVGSTIEPWSSFDDFELLDCVKEAISKEALGDLATIQPTAVQRLVIPALTGMGLKARQKAVSQSRFESFLIAAETGSGKTLSYIIPVMDFLKREEEILKKKEEEGEEGGKLLQEQQKKPDALFELEGPIVENRENNGKPRVVILVPTSELVNQVGAVIKSMSHVVKLRSALISRDFSGVVIRRRLFSGPVDILVSTPHLLSSLAEDDPRILSKCSHIIVDEADSLYDRTFSPLTSAIITRAENLKRLVLCSATIPKSLDRSLRKLYPEMTRLVTPHLHAIPRRVQLSIVDADAEPYKGNKPLACADTLHKISKDESEVGFIKKVIVFVNERESTGTLTSYLQSKGFDAISLERDTSNRKEASVLEYFTGPKTAVGPEVQAKDRMSVLVTTDISSRGVDTKTVKNVVLYDVPFSTIDFIHRLGRTGRMGRRGQAVILVDKNTNKAWVKDIKKYASHPYPFWSKDSANVLPKPGLCS
jgi:ATP-dependent RNA helicase MRH4